MERDVEGRSEFDLLGNFDARDDIDAEEPVSPTRNRFRLLLIISLIIGFLAALALVVLAVTQVIATGSQTIAESATSRPEGESANIEGISLPFVPAFVVFGLSFVGIIVGAIGTGLHKRRR